MNEYLKPIFDMVLPAIESANIKYWIYGGIGYASMVGQCYRVNTDVDLLVTENNFGNIEKILQNICKENNWKICKTFANSRPKIEIFLLKNKKKLVERLSVIPVCQKDDCIELKFKGGLGKYPLNILNQEKRYLDGFTFFTPSNEFLKKLFIEYLNSKRNHPSKRIEDAKHILSKEEFNKFFPDQSYAKS